MMRRFATITITIALMGCHKTAPTTGPPIASKGAKSYRVVGLVRKVDVEGKQLTIRHEEIPGYMPAMTMPFTIEDRDTLESVQVGDKVSATLKVDGDGRFDLVDVAIIEPAEPKAMTLDLSGGEAKLRPKVPKLEPGELVPDFVMTTQEGKSLRLSDLRGEVVVVTFIYTRCPRPDFCPKVDATFADVARLITGVKGRADKVRLLSVSFDPEHDTPEVLREHAKLRGARPPLWQFAVATHDELRKVIEPMGLVYGPTKDEIIHNLSTSVIGPDGLLVRRFEGSGWTAEDVFKTVRKVMPK